MTAGGLPTPGAAMPPVAENPFGVVLGAAVEQVSKVLKPEAAAVVAVTFGFPLALNVAVVLFLMAQGWVDRRDPKLRNAPQTANEGTIPFRDEVEL